MKMTPSSRSFALISFFSVVISVLSYEELIVLRPPLGAKPNTRILTCLAEDDDAALIWNYNSIEIKSIASKSGSADFEPKKPQPKLVTDCAIWNSTNCMIGWENINGWHAVNSTTRPMAPVYDFRWEGFKQFPPKDAMAGKNYEYVDEADKTSGKVIFSARGSNEIFLFLCKNKNRKKKPCIGIILGGWNGTASTIRSCVKRAPDTTSDKDCTDVAQVKHKDANIIDTHEWRTFRLEWNTKREAIEVFKDYAKEPFLKGKISDWHGVRQIWVKSETPSRVRFHSYEYFLTKKTEAVLSTKYFDQKDETFCVKMLVGLCPECELWFNLLNVDSKIIKTWNIKESKSSLDTDLLIWQSVKLKMNFGNITSRHVRLAIQTILNSDGGEGRWAVDNFRLCKPDDGIRKSRESFLRLDTNPRDAPWPLIKCQKLSLEKSIVVDSFSKEEYRDTSQLRQFLNRDESCNPRCPSFGKNWFICDRTGCTCDRGVMGSECDQDCSLGHYGYDCKQQCGSCLSPFCDRTTGHCSNSECKNATLVPPLCKTALKLEKPTILDITETTVQVLQEIELSADVENPVYFGIEEIGSDQKPYLSRVRVRPPSTYEADIKDLKPDTRYKVYTTVTVILPNSFDVTNNSERTFRTNRIGQPNFDVLPGRKNLTLTLASHEEICDLPRANGSSGDEAFTVRVYDSKGKPVGHCSTTSWCFRFNCTNLDPYAEYRLEVTQSDDLIFSKKVRTFEKVPIPPENGNLTSQGHGVVEFSWGYPFFKETKIKLFRIDVRSAGSNLLRVPTTPSMMPIDYHVTQETKRYSVELHLLPSTVYNVSVVAISEHNLTSRKCELSSKVPGDVGFASGEELHITHSGASIELKTPTVVNATRDAMVRITVEEIRLNGENRSEEMSPFTSPRNWTAAEYNVAQSQSESLTIECDQNQKLSSNCSLRIGSTYRIIAIVEDSDSEHGANLTSSSITLTERSQNLIWLVIFPFIAICLLLVFVVLRYRKRGQPLSEKVDDILTLTSTMITTGNSTVPRPASRLPPPLPNARENRVSIWRSTPDVVSWNAHSYSVEVREFEEYAKEAMASGLLDSQFRLLSTGPTKKSEYGKLSANLAKNRFKNLIPYDDTRVVLDRIPGDPHSDYINANYIKGYRKKRAYIATQGPKPETVKDFWRMIWQEEVQVICMLTNVTENGKSSCEQYWPEVGTKIKHGNVIVSNVEHQVFADYTIRTLSLGYKHTKREVTHLHYTGWPDRGVPMYTQSLVAYMKKLLATYVGKGPVVVHCSAGIGRTGTIILCDICLRKAVKERIFDVPDVTLKLREDRANMVENIQQYFLAHLIIMESMISEQTQIPCNSELPDKIEELRKRLPSDVQRLKDAVWQDRVLDSFTETRRSTLDLTETNILPEFIPATPTVSQFNRDSTFESESNYINAVSVDGVRMKQQYLESQLPSQFTLGEYWRLIAQKNIELVLVLQLPDPNDHTSCNIISEDPILVPSPYIRVETKPDVDKEEHFTIHRLLMTDISTGKPRHQRVTVLTCTEWEPGVDGSPPTVAALVSLWMASEKISRREAQTLVLCQDGVTGCGLYLALSFLLEKMAVERECDVISAVRAVRRSRTEFVQSLEQFEYLYDAAVNYYEFFQTYANFS